MNLIAPILYSKSEVPEGNMSRRTAKVDTTAIPGSLRLQLVFIFFVFATLNFNFGTLIPIPSANRFLLSSLSSLSAH